MEDEVGVELVCHVLQEVLDGVGCIGGVQLHHHVAHAGLEGDLGCGDLVGIGMQYDVAAHHGDGHSAYGHGGAGVFFVAGRGAGGHFGHVGALGSHHGDAFVQVGAINHEVRGVVVHQAVGGQGSGLQAATAGGEHGR